MQLLASQFLIRIARAVLGAMVREARANNLSGTQNNA